MHSNVYMMYAQESSAAKALDAIDKSKLYEKKHVLVRQVEHCFLPILSIMQTVFAS